MENEQYTFIKGKSNDAPLVVIPSFQNSGLNIKKEIEKITDKDFSLLTIYVSDWNNDLSPYTASSIFKGTSDFKGNADSFLDYVLKLIKKVVLEANIKPIFKVLVGYSMAGLFAVYALFKTNEFLKVGSVSGSLWYPHFTEFIENNEVLQGISTFYMSLGDKEKKTSNKIMSQVETNSLIVFERIKPQFNNSKFEFNPGNHFKDEDLRIAKCIAYLLNN